MTDRISVMTPGGLLILTVYMSLTRCVEFFLELGSMQIQYTFKDEDAAKT